MNDTRSLCTLSGQYVIRRELQGKPHTHTHTPIHTHTQTYACAHKRNTINAALIDHQDNYSPTLALSGVTKVYFCFYCRLSELSYRSHLKQIPLAQYTVTTIALVRTKDCSTAGVVVTPVTWVSLSFFLFFFLSLWVLESPRQTSPLPYTGNNEDCCRFCSVGPVKLRDFSC